MKHKNKEDVTAQIGDSNTANGDDAACPKSTKLANHGSPVSKNNVALVPAIQKIDSIKYSAPDFKDCLHVMCNSTGSRDPSRSI